MTIDELNKIKEAVSILDTAKFDREQRRIIIMACKYKLSAEAISIFADKAFDHLKMKEIMTATMNIPLDIVRRYAKPEYSLSLLTSVFSDYRLVGLSVEDIDEYVECWQNWKECNQRRFNALERFRNKKGNKNNERK